MNETGRRRLRVTERLLKLATDLERRRRQPGGAPCPGGVLGHVHREDVLGVRQRVVGEARDGRDLEQEAASQVSGVGDAAQRPVGGAEVEPRRQPALPRLRDLRERSDERT